MIIDAIKEGNTDLAITLLNDDRQLAHTVDETGLSAIIWAAYYKNDEVLNHIKNLDGIESTIYEACALNDLGRISELLESDPSLIEKYSADGFQVLGLASFFGQKDIVEFLIQNGADTNMASDNDFSVRPLHSAVASQSFDIAQLLLENGADPNLSQQNGILPIHSAAHIGHVDMIKLLLKHGAQSQIKSNDGKSTLDYAAESENYDEIEKLLKA